MSFWPCYHCLPNVLPCYPPHLFFFSYTTSRSHKGMRGRRANKPVMVQREREERRSRTKMWRWRGNESKDVVPPNQDSPVCVCWCSWMKMCLVCWAECTYMYMCVCVCVCVCGWSCIQLMCVGVCVQQTQLWLALQLITRYSQLLITQHLFCPRSALFCAYYQPGSLRRISRRALSNTPRLKCCFFFFFSPLGCCAAEDTSAYVSSKLRDPANGQASESNGARSFPWSLSGAEACLLSLMTLWQSRADQFRSTSCLEAPQCVF